MGPANRRSTNNLQSSLDEETVSTVKERIQRRLEENLCRLKNRPVKATKPCADLKDPHLLATSGRHDNDPGRDVLGYNITRTRTALKVMSSQYLDTLKGNKNYCIRVLLLCPCRAVRHAQDWAKEGDAKLPNEKMITKLDRANILYRKM